MASSSKWGRGRFKTAVWGYPAMGTSRNWMISYVISFQEVRLVVDTDVVVAAMRSPSGASAAILLAVREDKATLLLTVPLALEYEAVCHKAEHRLAAGLSKRQADIFVDAVIAMAQPVKTH